MGDSNLSRQNPIAFAVFGGVLDPIPLQYVSLVPTFLVAAQIDVGQNWANPSKTPSNGPMGDSF